MKHSSINLAALTLAGSMTMTGCAVGNLSGDVYSREEARIAQSVEPGVVVSSTPVTIEGNLNGNLGSGGGALIGGYAGASLGNGRGSELASILGGLAGAAAGQRAEERLTRKQAQEITVARPSGETIVVVQEVVDGNFFQSGEQVRLISNGGVVRIRY